MFTPPHLTGFFKTLKSGRSVRHLNSVCVTVMGGLEVTNNIISQRECQQPEGHCH